MTQRGPKAPKDTSGRSGAIEQRANMSIQLPTLARTTVTRWINRTLLALAIAVGIGGFLETESVSANAPAASIIAALPAGEAETDIDAFWNETLTDAGYGYYTPSLVGFDQGITTGGCGYVEPQSYSSFYCQVDSTVYYSIPTIAGEIDRFGDAGWVHIMAHEWGHHVQLLTGILATQGDVMTLELQATCFAGVYVQNAVDRGLISTDAVVVMKDMLAGDASHGSREALVGSFDQGYDGDLAGCGLSI